MSPDLIRVGNFDVSVEGQNRNKRYFKDFWCRLSFVNLWIFPLTSVKVGYQKVLRRFSWSTFSGIRCTLTRGYLWNLRVSRKLKVLKTGYLLPLSLEGNVLRKAVWWFRKHKIFHLKPHWGRSIFGVEREFVPFTPEEAKTGVWTPGLFIDTKKHP